MNTEVKAVKLESLKGAWTVTTALPNGRNHVVEFKQAEKDGPFVAEVPLKLEYLDVFGKKQVYRENYPQDLLNAYNPKDQYGEYYPDRMHLKVLQIVEAPLINAPVVTEAPVSKRERKDKQ